MVTIPSSPNEPIRPGPEDVQLANRSARQLAAYTKNNALKLRIVENGQDGDMLELPASAVQLMVQLLKEMGKGHAVTLIPHHAELTTQQAADLLNVSRPFIVELCDTGKLPFSRFGSHRKIRFSDLITFKEQSLSDSHQALDELANMHQKMGGYDNQ